MRKIEREIVDIARAARALRGGPRNPGVPLSCHRSPRRRRFPRAHKGASATPGFRALIAESARRGRAAVD
jgi:hypothetical protein